jgi:hypothetical protein
MSERSEGERLERVETLVEGMAPMVAKLYEEHIRRDERRKLARAAFGLLKKHVPTAAIASAAGAWFLASRPSWWPFGSP